MGDPVTGVHRDRPVLVAGAPLEKAHTAVVALHGRGADARDILGIAAELGTDGVAYLAPEAADHTWYPYSFLAPIERNEPYLSSALETVGRVVEHLGRHGVPPERTVLLGFSQGACLALEYAARHPRRYRALVGWSGGLIGPPGALPEHTGSLDGTPVFLGCSDVDPHIPAERVRETADILRGMGADVDMRFYPGMPHTVNEEEVEAARALVASPRG